MTTKTLTVGPFQSNCFVLSCDDTKEAIIADAGDEATRILDYVTTNDLKVQFIINTHAHIDHVSGLAEVVEALSVPVLMHQDETPVYDNVAASATMFGLPVPRSTKIDRFISGGDEIKFGNVRGRIIDTPGHSPGGITIVFEDETPPAAIVGDVLFAGSIGRTDLPGADHNVMMSTLKNVIMTFPDDMIVYSGHGPDTTIGHEKGTNPFLLSLSE